MKEVKKFEELEISDNVKKALNDIGYINMTDIQARAIPELLKGKDLIGQSQTGTGKTAAFGIPNIEKVDKNDRNTQTIILCPTRELAIQVSEDIRGFLKYTENVKLVTIYGGQSIDIQIRELKRGAQIIVGTPGRVMDHMRRKTLKLQNVTTVILDEADEMLNMGFEEDIETILKDVPKSRQTVLFSATMNRRILNITKKYITDPINIHIEAKELTVENIDQTVIEMNAREKDSAVMNILKYENPKKALIFCNTKRKCDSLVELLKSNNFAAENLHGDMRQSQRDRIMRKLKSGEISILIATDVVARGIDIDELELVINYDIPQEDEYYVHRIGRTGRNGEKGKSITFVTSREKTKLRDLEKFIKVKIRKGIVPTNEEINKIDRGKSVETIENLINSKRFANLDILEALKEKYSIEEIAKALISNLNTKVKESTQNIKKDYVREENKSFGNSGKVKLFLNLGKKDNIQVKDIVGSITANAMMSSDEIGEIRLLEKFAFIEVSENVANKIIQNMKDKTIKGKDVKIEIAKS